MWLTFTQKKLFMVIAVASVILYGLSLLRVQSVIWGDALYYYAYTRSLAMDRDISFENEGHEVDFGFPHPPQISERTGRIINKFSLGAPLLWLPAFAVGQVMSVAAQNIGFVVRTDGYSWITQITTGLGALGFSVLGLWLLYDAVARLWDRSVATVVSLVLFSTTPLWYYTAVDPLNSHSASFLFSALLLWLMVRFSDKSYGKYAINWQRAALLGLVGGVAALIRNQDIVVVVPAIIMVLVFAKAATVRERFNYFVIAGGVGFLVLSIQLLTTVWLFGQLGSPYQIGGEGLRWFQPDFVRVLLSAQNGLFFFAPSCLFALFWLMQMTRTHFSWHRQFALVAMVIFGLQLYVIAAWSPEIIGGPYGSRMFVSVLPWLSLGLAFGTQQLLEMSRQRQLTAVAIWAVFSANTLIQTAIMLYRF